MNWKELLLGEEDWDFLLMAGIRSFVMFFVIVVGLRVLGKRGVHQLSVFELGVIIGLGSAAGDPMFYRSVGLLVCIVVFVVVLVLYHFLELATTKSDKLGTAVEGEPHEVLRNGVLVLETFDKEPFSEQELFMQLRLQHVSHLGQVRCAILEPSGDVSTFYFADEDVVPGLPILPGAKVVETIETPGDYACAKCGRIAHLQPGNEKCAACKHDKWARAIDERRLT
jgi:uncharacterized membrane protein YcaP (DUF421 family)